MILAKRVVTTLSLCFDHRLRRGDECEGRRWVHRCGFLRATVKFYDVAGPHVVVGAYARTDLGASVPTGSNGARAGVDAMFGGNVAVLGATLTEYSRSLFDLGQDFAK